MKLSGTICPSNHIFTTIIVIKKDLLCVWVFTLSINNSYLFHDWLVDFTDDDMIFVIEIIEDFHLNSFWFLHYYLRSIHDCIDCIWPYLCSVEFSVEIKGNSVLGYLIDVEIERENWKSWYWVQNSFSGITTIFINMYTVLFIKSTF